MPKDIHIVVTAVGRDRPGLIAGVSSIVASLNGNIEDLDQVTMKNAIFVMSMLVDFARCEKSFKEIRETLINGGKQLGLKVEVYNADLIRG
jgi:ACT domain-containing protein